MQLAAEAVAAGDVSAITPYLKVIDQLDRYQAAASAEQVYDDEARKKLMDKINRMADNFGIDEVSGTRWAGVHESPARSPPRSWARPKGRSLARPPDSWARRARPRHRLRRRRPIPDFFT